MLYVYDTEKANSEELVSTRLSKQESSLRNRELAGEIVQEDILYLCQFYRLS